MHSIWLWLGAPEVLEALVAGGGATGGLLGGGGDGTVCPSKPTEKSEGGGGGGGKTPAQGILRWHCLLLVLSVLD